MKTKNNKTVLRLSPSSAEVWLNCPGSLVVKSQASKFRKKSPEAVLGDVVHKVIAARLNEEKPKLSVEESNVYGLEKANIDAQVKFALSFTDKNATRRFVERELSFTVGGVEFYGFVDYAEVLPRAFYGFIDYAEVLPTSPLVGVKVFDWKSGWQEVEAENNPQLRLYAHLVGAAVRIPVTEAEGVIVSTQLRQYQPVPIHYDPLLLAEVADDMRAKVERAKPVFKVGPHCYKCNAARVCKPFQAEQKKFISDKMRDFTVARDENWPELLDISQAVIKFMEGVRSEAFQWLQNGGQIRRYEVAFKNGHRAWRKDAVADLPALAKKLGLRLTDLQKVALESPAGVEKKLTAKGKSLDEFASMVYAPQVPYLKRTESGDVITKKAKKAGK